MSTSRLARLAFVAAFVLAFASPVLAQNLDSDTAISDAAAPAMSPHFPMPGVPMGDAPKPPTQQALQVAGPSKRPALLLPLYASAAALEAMDLYTTYRGLNAGAHETNPLVRNGNVATTIALKAATASLGMVIAEKMWKKNKAAAIAAMIASNVVSASIVAHNYRVLKSTR